MSKFQVFIVVFAVLAAIAQAEPLQRQRVSARQRTRVLARQEAVDEAPVTPYPSADELKPEVPFEEGVAEVPAEAIAPVEPQPDEVYGPPEAAANIPDEVYGPPENALPAEEPAAEQFPAPLDDQQARYVAAKRNAALRQRQRIAAYRQAVAAKRSAKLRAFAAKKRSA